MSATGRSPAKSASRTRAGRAVRVRVEERQLERVGRLAEGELGRASRAARPSPSRASAASRPASPGRPRAYERASRRRCCISAVGTLTFQTSPSRRITLITRPPMSSSGLRP